MADRFDLILCMENHHRLAVMSQTPQAEDKVFSLRDFLVRARQAPPEADQTLAEWVAALCAIPTSNPAGIRDPLPEGTEEAYEATANELNALLQELASMLVVLGPTR